MGREILPYQTPLKAGFIIDEKTGYTKGDSIMLNNSKEFMGSLLLEKDVGLIGSSNFLSEKHPIEEPPDEPPGPKPPIKDPPKSPPFPEPPKNPPDPGPPEPPIKEPPKKPPYPEAPIKLH